MSAIYNEIDPFAVRWLRNLITAGHIAPGVVDERSISDLVPADVAGVGQRHFFAGIAGWSLALRLAGVPDDANVWTGSCPCQGLSSAGKRLGFDDPRHLWPVWFGLIRECRPAVVFGEQVASSLGWAWLDLVFADLEGAGYACAAADLPACGVGAPHRRQRLFFVAYSAGERRHGVSRDAGSRRKQPESTRGGEAIGMANAKAAGRGSRRIDSPHGRSAIEPHRYGNDSWTPCEWIPCSDGAQRGGPVVELAHPARGRRGEGNHDGQASAHRGSRSSDGGWTKCEWTACSDGVSRPVEPGTHPLAHGVPGRVGLLRGYGNAIVPQVAAEFVCAALEAA